MSIFSKLFKWGRSKTGTTARAQANESTKRLKAEGIKWSHSGKVTAEGISWAGGGKKPAAPSPQSVASNARVKGTGAGKVVGHYPGLKPTAGGRVEVVGGLGP